MEALAAATSTQRGLEGDMRRQGAPEARTEEGSTCVWQRGAKSGVLQTETSSIDSVCIIHGVKVQLTQKSFCISFTNSQGVQSRQPGAEDGASLAQKKDRGTRAVH